MAPALSPQTKGLHREIAFRPLPATSEDAGSKTGQKCELQPLPSYIGKGGVFLTLGLPEHFIVGLDAMAMTTNKSLLGFREIPQGAHFLWVQQPSGVSRCGYWFTRGVQAAVRTKKWDAQNETLGEPSQAEAREVEASVKSVYPTLQPYTLHAHRDVPATALEGTLPEWARSPGSLWHTLTNAISDPTLERITSRKDVNEYLVDSMDCAKDTFQTDNRSSGDGPTITGINNNLNFLFTQDFHDLQVLDLGPTQSRVADTSLRVQSLLNASSTNPGPATEEDILAELQFTFLTGTHLGNPACLEQWWNLVLKIVLRAYTLAGSRPRLSRGLLQTLHAQLFYAEHYVGPSSSQPGDDEGAGQKGLSSEDRPIFEYKPQNKDKLYRGLVGYKRRLNDMALSGQLGYATAEQQLVRRTFEELESWLWRRGWDLSGEQKIEREMGGMRMDDSDEEEDEQPVVVELDEDGREVGLVSFRD